MSDGVDRPTGFDEYQRHLREREWGWEDVSDFYEGRGTEQSIVPLQELDYLDVYERVYGRRIGASGIGRLEEVALSEITDAETRIYDESLPYRDAPELLTRHGVGTRGIAPIADVSLCRSQQEGYAELLEREGVSVRWIDWGEEPVSAYGPMHGMWVASEVLVVGGGAIVPKRGRDPFSFGRGEWLSRWLFWELNIPTLLTVAGRGIAEVGSLVWLAEDVFVVGDSIAYNEEGRSQVLPVVERSSRASELQVLTVHCQGQHYFDPATGGAAHVDNLIAPLDVDKVLCYTPGIDTPTLLWLKQNGYQVVQADFDDHVGRKVCNLTILEPGRVAMSAEARTTIERVREAGVDVVETPYSGFHGAGGGLHSATLELQRAPGPARL